MLYYTLKWLLKQVRHALHADTLATVQLIGRDFSSAQMDPNRGKKDAAQELGSKLMKRLEIAGVELSEYENMVAADVIDPADLKVSWADVGGLDKTIESLKVTLAKPSAHHVALAHEAACPFRKQLSCP